MGCIRSVLIANRAEIACRIIRTARAMGIESVAVFSDDDRLAPHVRAADRAVRLPGSSARDTYLNQDRVLAAAVAAGVDAVHPGYGFLSEDHTFARRCEEQGLVFVGPPSGVIEQMALKDAAKDAAVRAGLPVLAGVSITGDDEPAWVTQTAGVGYPLIVKAVAGGGGRGMHVVADEDELVDAIRAARREAGNLFGSPGVIVERYLPAPRHVEVQVLSDAYGAAVHLFERECSIQRRHQKVIEEAPAPSVDEDLRRGMGEAAVALVTSLGYRGVGTAEFLLDDTGAAPEFFFLEMNTRLQVEHPVTEEITGLDLVRLQFEVAEGRPLPFGQQDLAIHGHAIEARLYAEDPLDDFTPRPGELLDFGHPELDGVRYENGVPAGSSTVSARYDPMLSKIVAHGATRSEATRRLAAALRRLRLHGITTNRDFLLDILDTPAFAAAQTRTDFIDSHPELTTGRAGELPVQHLAALVAVTALRQTAHAAVPFALPGFRILPDVWSPVVAYQRIGGPGDPVDVSYRFEGQVRTPLLHLRVGDDQHVFAISDVTDASARVASGDLERHYDVAQYPDGSTWVNDATRQTGWRVAKRADSAAGQERSGRVVAALPGTVVSVAGIAGQHVDEGEELLRLEAMKMEHPIRAPRSGRLELHVRLGEFVQAGALLADVLPEPVAAAPA